MWMLCLEKIWGMKTPTHAQRKRTYLPYIGCQNMADKSLLRMGYQRQKSRSTMPELWKKARERKHP